MPADNLESRSAASGRCGITVAYWRSKVDVKIGVADTGRELVVNSTASPEEIEAQVAHAFKDPSSTLTLVDEKGRKVLIPSAKIAYVEIAPADSRRVGFMVAD
ncbi:DUF3107 domain-containing protein [Nakamurella antarctica]|uniref:DUF3107 domain-containing protein n=2 Tax=Nakamurella antarctica TaxID=1902245 RepID=A0A3G8ZQG7_9ACTN|nr:DUF3107 domain-containing protein [Nakamurella antarctica]